MKAFAIIAQGVEEEHQSKIYHAKTLGRWYLIERNVARSKTTLVLLLTGFDDLSPAGDISGSTVGTDAGDNIVWEDEWEKKQVDRG